MVTDMIPVATMRPYKQFQVREFEEIPKDDFIKLLVCAEYMYVRHHDGIMWLADTDRSEYGDGLKADDILLFTYVHYCFMPYVETITTAENLKISVVRCDTAIHRALADLAWRKKREESKKK